MYAFSTRHGLHAVRPRPSEAHLAGTKKHRRQPLPLKCAPTPVNGRTTPRPLLPPGRNGCRHRTERRLAIAVPLSGDRAGDCMTARLHFGRLFYAGTTPGGSGGWELASVHCGRLFAAFQTRGVAGEVAIATSGRNRLKISAFSLIGALISCVRRRAFIFARPGIGIRIRLTNHDGYRT